MRDFTANSLTHPKANVNFALTNDSPGEITLRQAETSRPSVDFESVDLRRRNFLVRVCQGAGASLIPAGWWGLSFPGVEAFSSRNSPSPSTGFHLQPHYRSERLLDATLLKVRPGLDNFVTEKYADQIAAILADWSTGLLQSPPGTKAIAKFLAADFFGTNLTSTESRAVRSSTELEVRQNRFARQQTLGRDNFLREWTSRLSVFSRILNAEFQVTGIDTDGAAPSSSQSLPRLRTSIRYEIVGTGNDFHREQWVGNWNLEWEPTSSIGFCVRSWQALDETQARSASPIYADITSRALGGNSSYSAQMLHGTDYWRTVLDGACGIDIYGHNGVSVADIDNDGFDDLYICQPAGLPNRLYRNRGDGTFEDITESSGLGILDNTACALFADFSNQGRQDVIVVRASGPLFFLNEGGGKFHQVPDAFRFASPPQGTFTGAAAADYDRDGWLGVYFCLYAYYQGTGQ